MAGGRWADGTCTRFTLGHSQGPRLFGIGPHISSLASRPLRGFALELPERETLRAGFEPAPRGFHPRTRPSSCRSRPALSGVVYAAGRTRTSTPLVNSQALCHRATAAIGSGALPCAPEKTWLSKSPRPERAHVSRDVDREAAPEGSAEPGSCTPIIRLRTGRPTVRRARLDDAPGG